MRWRIGGGSASWRLAKSLVSLLEQVDGVWPENHRTDGTVGDLSHQARKSDHNPNTARVVTAADIGVYGLQGSILISELVKARDPRVKYIIHRYRIWRSYPKPGLAAWTPTQYTGWNPHKDHVHISVSSTASKYDNPAPWNINLGGDAMAFTEHEETVLKGIVAHIDAIGSDPSFVTYAVELIRKERELPLHAHQP